MELIGIKEGIVVKDALFIIRSTWKDRGRENGSYLPIKLLLKIPIHWQADELAGFGLEEKIAVGQSEEEEVFRDLHILFAVSYDFVNLAFFEPLQRLQAVGGFHRIERLVGQVIEGKAVSQLLGDFLEDVKGFELSEAKR